MVLVKGGTFKMGSTNGNGDEKTVHQVTVSDFYISKYEVTFEEYDAFCEATGKSKPNDSGWGRGNRPVINISWHDATAYCQWLSKQTGLNYRLPTEAEWEYAARGGSTGSPTTYAGSNNIGDVAEYEGNNDKKTMPAGGKKPNELGLYDMSGNVWEWCSDWYGGYSSSSQTNPQGPTSGFFRVYRGGSWIIHAGDCRVADRRFGSPGGSRYDLGFRPVRSVN